MDMMESGQAPQLPLAGGQNRSGRVERLAAGGRRCRLVGILGGMLPTSLVNYIAPSWWRWHGRHYAVF